MKIVFDTNIFIAAALKGGFSEDLLKMAASNIVTLVCSEDILDELLEKLVGKFKWQKDDPKFFVETIKEISEIVKIREKISVVIRDPQDNKILECAISGEVDLIVSSDQDLIKLKKFRSIAIVHPKTLSWIFPEYFKEKGRN